MLNYVFIRAIHNKCNSIKNKYNFMDVFFELQTYNIIIPEWSTSIPDDSIIVNEILLDNFVLEK